MGQKFDRMSKAEKMVDDHCLSIAKATCDWVSELKEIKPCSDTIINYKKAIRHLVAFLRSNGKTFNDIDEDLYNRFCEYFATLSGLSKITKHLYYCSIKTVLKFLMNKGIIGGFNLKHIRLNTVLSGASVKIRMVPSFNDIIKLRQLPIPIERALLIEFCLSSGLRIGEAVQIRYCDLKIGDVPIDIKTGTKTEFAAGSISVNANIHTIKTRSSRVTYFSKLAYKLLKMHMRLNGINSFDSKMPIFPWCDGTIDIWFDDIEKMMEFESINKAVMVSSVNLESEFNITKEDLELLPDNIKLLVERRVAERISNIESRPKIKDKFSECFSCHSLRHAFTCIQMFRDYAGGRGNEWFVRSMLGHKGRNTILIYLSKINLVRTDDEWKRIFVGFPSDWTNITLTGKRKPAMIRRMIAQTRKKIEDPEEESDNGADDENDDD
jgi:integrase